MWEGPRPWGLRARRIFGPLDAVGDRGQTQGDHMLAPVVRSDSSNDSRPLRKNYGPANGTAGKPWSMSRARKSARGRSESMLVLCSGRSACIGLRSSPPRGPAPAAPRRGLRNTPPVRSDPQPLARCPHARPSRPEKAKPPARTCGSRARLELRACRSQPGPRQRSGDDRPAQASTAARLHPSMNSLA